jgi:hypothetical protein
MLIPGGRGKARERAGRLAAHPEQDLTRGQGVEDRLHHRLHQPVDASAWPGVIPAFERVVLREQQVAERRGLVEIERGGNLEADLDEAAGEAAALGERVGRVGVVHQDQGDVTGVHRLREPRQLGVTVGGGQLGAEAHRLADVPGYEVEDVHRRAGLGGRRVLRPHSARHRQTGARRGEFPREALDRLGAEPGLLRRHGRSERGEGGREPHPIIAPLGEQHVRHRQRQRRFRTRLDRHPFVGVEAGEVPARGGIDELGDIALGEPVGPGEAALILDRRAPALQEIGPEGDDVLRLAEVMRRHLVEPEDLTVGGAHRLVIKAFVAHQPPAERRGPFGKEIREGAARGAADHRHPVAGLAQLAGEPGDGVIPGDLHEAAVGGPGHRRLDPARVVEALQRGLPAGAELALVDRVLGIALELDRASLAGAYVHAAPGGALGAGARVPGRYAGHLILGLHQVGHQLLHPVGGAATQRHGAAAGRNSQHGEEAAAIYGRGAKVVRHSGILSVVTYRTVPRHPALRVAGDAEAHVVHPVDLEDLGHAAHVAVAGGARGGAEHLDVPLVREVGVTREEVDPDPFHRLLLGPGLPQLPDLGPAAAVAAGDDEVAAHAGLHTGNPRLRRDIHRVVAVLTLHLELAGVDVVPEKDRLAGTPERPGITDDRCRDRIGGGLGLLGLRTRSREREHGRESAGPDAAEHDCQRSHYRSHAE